MMGAGAAAGAETWERSRADGPKTLEDVKSVLSGGSRFAPGLLKKASFGSGLREAAALPPIPRELVEVGRSRDASVKGKEDESDARSVRSVASSRSRQPTDYSREEEQTRDRLGADLGRDKMTIGDRLASIPMLGRLGISERGGQSPGPGGSPNSLTRELPGPPPPAKPASSTSFFSFSSRAARSGSYSQPVLITKTDSSEGAASSVVRSAKDSHARLNELPLIIFRMCV